MLELRTLGGLDVESELPLGKAASQPRRLALLAVLAEASERGLSRDALIGLLWPEQNAESARHNLTQTLYALRRDLGAEGLFSGTSRVTLNPALLSCDLWMFRRALKEMDWQSAVDLYRGPFLSGVFVSHTTEFDRWVDQVRQNLAADYARAIERLAAGFADRGEHTRAGALWLRLSSFEPNNARVMGEVARQMCAAGDRAGALNAIHEFGTRLREDLALPLDAELIQLADSIRREIGHRPEPAPRSHSHTPTHDQEVTPVRLALVAPIRRRRTLVVIAAGALAVATALVASANRRPKRFPPGTTSVAVLPFALHGDSVEAFLGDGMARLVAQGLDGVGRIQASMYPEIARLLVGAGSAADTSAAISRQFQLDRYVAGAVTLVGGTIQVRAVLHDMSRRGTALGTALVTGSRDSVFNIADKLTRRLLGIEPTPGSTELVKRASETTPSLEAFKAFVKGEELFRASKYPDAVAAYQRAVTEDTTFALAHYRLAEALDWNAQGSQIPPVAAAALRFAHRLPWRERRLLEGSTAWRSGRNDEAESNFQQVTSRYPNDAEAWFALAEVLFHSNSIRARVFLESEPAFRRVLALDPTNRGALTHLGRVRAYLGDSRGADSMLLAAEALMPEGPDIELALFHAAAAGDSTGQAAAVERLMLDKSGLVGVTVYRLAAYARDLPAADSVLAHAFRAGLSRDGRVVGRYWAAVVAGAQGQMERALKETDALAEVDLGGALELQATLISLPSLGDGYSGADRQATLLRLRNANVGSRLFSMREGIGTISRWYLLGLLAWRSEDVTSLTRYADSLSATRVAGGPMAAAYLAAALHGLQTDLAGSPAEALGALARLPDAAELNDGNVVGSLLNERYLRASLLERQDRAEEALAVYGSLIFGNPNSLLLVVPASLQRARLLVRLGRVEEAGRDYLTVMKVWRHADAALQPIVDSARTELARIR